MSIKWTLTSVLLCLATLLFGAAAYAQSDDTIAAQEVEEVPELAIDVLENGILYNERGELVIRTSLTNVGTRAVPPLNVIVVLLNDCILTNVPQTCRFAAFGSFNNVIPNGLPGGTATDWVFNFGAYPRLDLERWTVIWYPIAATPASAE